MAQWLHQIKPEINISANNNEAFKSACFYGNLVMAQWLYQIKPEINIYADNDYVFKTACKKNNLHIAQWLCNLSQFKYHVKISDNCIINWYINSIPIYQSKNINITKMCLCSICYETKSNIQTNCLHLYCLACIIKWHTKSSKCPLCRQQITYMNQINKNEFILYT
jgi:hypothetical protein